MTGPEKGFLLLTCHMGDPYRRPLTVAQFRELALRVKHLSSKDRASQLQTQDLMDIGYCRETAQYIIGLLSQEAQLERYVQAGERRGCVPIARVSAAYPIKLKQCLKLESPGCLWAKGDLTLLQKPAIALVGSRDLQANNAAFAAQVGIQAARQGYVLISGNARGADRTAQDSCLAAGGQVISVVADRLDCCPKNPNVLYLSEEGYDLDFTAARALSRNRVIHCLPQMTFVAQCTAGRGGTWSGTTKNLKNRWSPVFCLDDGSQGASQLFSLGAKPFDLRGLNDLSKL